MAFLPGGTNGPGPMLDWCWCGVTVTVTKENVPFLLSWCFVGHFQELAAEIVLPFTCALKTFCYTKGQASTSLHSGVSELEGGRW